VVVTQGDRYLADFWQQFGNSLYIGVATMLLTGVLGSLASFAAGRMRLDRRLPVTAASLLTFMIPAGFLIIPFYLIMHIYGLSDSLWAVIAAQVTFATPFAILIMRHYANLIPLELDDAARIDGASAFQVYLRIYLPLIAPALAVVAVYALVLAWNDYLYQAVLLTSPSKTTVSMMQGDLFEDPDAEWNAMMAAVIIYALPPLVILFALRRYATKGLATGGAGG
jgi:multiple sugar transport system permease protein